MGECNMSDKTIKKSALQAILERNYDVHGYDLPYEDSQEQKNVLSIHIDVENIGDMFANILDEIDPSTNVASLRQSLAEMKIVSGGANLYSTVYFPDVPFFETEKSFEFGDGMNFVVSIGEYNRKKGHYLSIEHSSGSEIMINAESLREILKWYDKVKADA